MKRLSAAMLATAATLFVVPFTAYAQATGVVGGTVVRSNTISPLPGALVEVVGTGMTTSTGQDGRYNLVRVPAGAQTIEFRSIGFAPYRTSVVVAGGQTLTVNATLEANVIRLSDMIVSSASRAPERITEAPAAITVVPPDLIRAMAPTGQAPLALATVPGVDVVQNGINDFNVNSRGFNSSLTRRVLVLEDGRDVAIAFLGSQEWSAMGMSLDDYSRIEMVRGPGSALYGANAFSGVLALTSKTAREASGSRLTLAMGELATKRIDARHAGVFAGERFGYKLGLGYSSSDTWSRSRTAIDSLDIVREYDPVTDSVVRKSREARPLVGQQVQPGSLNAIGDRTPVSTGYASARFDYYAPSGALGTVEGGLVDLRNETFVTGLGRVQVAGVQRPWGRAAWATKRLNLLTWYTGRQTREPQWSLPSGVFFLEHSSIVHGEAQYNNVLPNDLGTWIVGASARSTHMNTSQTLIAPANDNRDDVLYSSYGQVEFRLSPRLKLVAATRWDDGDLFDPQFSPKAAVVFSPSRNSSFRASVNKAFQTPNYSEFFLDAAAAAPTASPRTLEVALENFLATGRAIGTAGLPPTNDLPWNFDAQTRVRALGNRALDVEKIIGYELGYKGPLTRRGYVTVDVFLNDKKDFVTDLLPNVNPAYPQYSYTDAGTNVPAYLDAIAARAAALAGAIPEAQRQAIIGGAAALKSGYNALVAGTQPLLATVDGHRALVVSYANAGRVKERGVELGSVMQFSDVLRGEASYAFFDFSVEDASLGNDALLPNTPEHKGSLALFYDSPRRIELNASVRLVSGYPWAAGVFSGYVPASQFVNANAAYRATEQLKAFVTGTNVFDQRRFQLYGGSVIGRRLIGGVTATF
ncbi:MAG TPA: TonB-dependent receptor [Gemmatimonadaceae bacterium]|nr:TonB-dependent receptor [Gemmatimonadaceae bacterium]